MRGDREDLRTALVDGAFIIRFLDGDERQVGELEVSADGPVELGASIPERAVRVDVSGRAVSGDLVATGAAGVNAEGGCVCVAFVEQHPAVCAEVVCVVEDDTCLFRDAETGAAPGSRTLRLGENSDDDVSGVTTDTQLEGSDPTRSLWNFGASSTFGADADPQVVGLLRFELGTLPRAAIVESATLTLEREPTDSGSSREIGFYRVLEPWHEGSGTADPGCASWTCRQDGVNWAVPGCGYLNETVRSREVTAVASVVDDPDPVHTIDLVSAVTGWVTSPSTNFGVAVIVNAPNGTDFLSSEADPALGRRPRLEVTFRVP